jgi:hypothetical protein
VNAQLTYSLVLARGPIWRRMFFDHVG